MRTKHAVAALAGLLLAVSLTGQAGAAEAKPVRTFVAPPAPAGADLLGGMGIAAAAPETTPGVTYHPVAPGGTYSCGAGYFCPLVWNPVEGQWRVFFMYYCRIQTLYNWMGDGTWLNNQIPPVNPVSIYDQNWNYVATPVVENPRRTRPIDWTPAWYIDVC